MAVSTIMNRKKKKKKKKNGKHFVSPINLIIAIIINYRLSIERSFLEFTVMIFIFFFCTLCLFLMLLSTRPRALSAGLLFSDTYARVKSSLCLRPFRCKKMCTTETMVIISFSRVFQKFGYFFFFLQHSVHSF